MTNAERRNMHRALALVTKFAQGKSSDEMIAEYQRYLETGVLRLRKVPHQNTLSRWVNDERLTPILRDALKTTAKVFRAMETAAIVDSTKMSQMPTAHSRYVEYGDDVRDEADWMKIHLLVGVETLVCMDVEFSGSIGAGTHDINFLIPLVKRVINTFSLKYVLADKAYLSEMSVGKLWDMGIQAVIPIKKQWNGEKMKSYYAVFQDLITWYKDQPSFHEVYRLRPKIESFNSLLKRVTDGYCWSRGRPRLNQDGAKIHNAKTPCVAWINETLCKLIYVNLRLIVRWELITGYRMSFLNDTFFPPIPPGERLIEEDDEAA
jgi:hypothetical protein